MIELWRTLKAGDRIPLVEIPPEFFRKSYYVHRDTMRAYRMLIARGRSLRVSEIDEWGLPWVNFRFRRKDGTWDYHSLAVNHGGIVRVQPRRPSPRSD